MNHRPKELLKLLSIPLVLLVLYVLTYVIWQILGLPSDDQLLVIVRGWFAHYGLWVVFISAVIEGFLLLGQYFPGGFIIFLGVISAGKDIPRAAGVVSMVCLAFFIAYTLNYWVGKYGWYKLLAKFGLRKQIEHSKEKLIRQGLNAIFFSYWEPNLASLTATAAGILNVPLRKFSLYSALGIILWNIFWGTLVYVLGESALKIAGLKWILTIFAVWIFVIILKKFLSNKISRKKAENINISDRWDFGEDREFADRLKSLILEGKKTATTGLFRNEERHSSVGEYDELIGSDGKPFCVIHYTKVEIKPFLDVDFEYAKLEGEGDADIEEWRQGHRKFFLKYYPDFTDDMSVVCAEFRMIETN